MRRDLRHRRRPRRHLRRLALRRLAARLVRRPGGSRRRAAVPGERHPRPGDPAGAAARGGRALPRLRRREPHQRAEPRSRRCPREGPRRTRSRPAGLLGQPQLGPLPHRHVRADGRRRGHPGARRADVRLLVVLRVPAVPREPRRRRGAAGGPGAGGRPGAPLLQPPRLRRGDGGEHAGRRRRASPGRTCGCPAGLRDPLDPDVDERRQRTGRRRVRDAAPRRRPAGDCRCDGGVRRGARLRPRLLQPQRTPDPALARARRQRPPRSAGRRGDTRRRAGADRLRLRPHGGEVRPRHRGHRDRRATRPAVHAGGDRRHRPGLRRVAPRAGAGAGGDRPRRGAGPRRPWVRSARATTSARPVAVATNATPTAPRCAEPRHERRARHRRVGRAARGRPRRGHDRRPADRRRATARPARGHCDQEQRHRHRDGDGPARRAARGRPHHGRPPGRRLPGRGGRGHARARPA